jgi:hypothetical protein
MMRELSGYKTRGNAGANATVEESSAKWVQCERPECLKWRKLPSWLQDDQLPEKFTCELNKWVPSDASCDVPEENYAEEITVDWDLGDTFEALQFGAAVDAYCSKHSCWASAIVVSLDKTAVRVRFDRWGQKVEETITRQDASNRLAPPNTIGTSA